MDKTMRDDPRIVAVGCWGACFGGYKGMDTCGKCRGTGSQLAVRGFPNRRFPNTEEGYRSALNLLDTNTWEGC